MYFTKYNEPNLFYSIKSDTHHLLRIIILIVPSFCFAFLKREQSILVQKTERERNMPRYYCEYCRMHLTHSTVSAIKEHNYGYKHRDNVRLYYMKFLSDPKYGGCAVADDGSGHGGEVAQQESPHASASTWTAAP